jgi:hypothetical protein
MGVFLILVGALDAADLGVAVIDKQPRQIEHAGHPGDHRDDMHGLEPEKKFARIPVHSSTRQSRRNGQL